MSLPPLVVCVGPGEQPAVRVVHLDRVRQRVDALVEVEPHDRGRLLHSLCRTRAASSSASRAPRPPPGRRARRAPRRAAASPVRLPGERREVPEDRGHVAVGVEEDREHDERQREAGAPHARARPEDDQRAGRSLRQRGPAQLWCRNAARANSQPFCSWISSEAPETARASGTARCHARLCSFPRSRPSSAAPGEHHRLRPHAVGDQVDRRVGEEDHHRPHQHPEAEEEARPEVGAPGATAPDLFADDRPREQQQPSSRNPVANIQWTCSAGGCIVLLAGLRLGLARSVARTRSPTATTSSGGSTSSHQKPSPCGCSIVSRYGCRNAQATPPSIVSGPSAATSRARGRAGTGSARSG